MDTIQSKGDMSRDQILLAAVPLFIRKGYRGTSLSDLCQATGFTKGGLYHHFAGKDELYKATLAQFFDLKSPPEWMTQDFPNLRQRLLQGFEDIDRSKIWIQKRVGSKKDDAILQFYGFLYEATRRYPEFQKAIDVFDDQKYKVLEAHFQQAQNSGEIRKDIDPRLLALECDAMLQQLIYLRFVNPRIKVEKELPRALFENYWKRLVPS